MRTSPPYPDPLSVNRRLDSPGRGYAHPVPTTDVPRTSVSIVITNHDYGRFLRSAIDSALAQDHPDTEVIVVDDGSTDDSREVIESYGPRITPRFGPNLGQGHAINIGFEASVGDVVIFLDADDRLRPWAARRVAEVFRSRADVARVQMPLAVIDGDGRPTGARMPSNGHSLFVGDARARLLSCPDDIAWQPTSGNAFSRRALEKVLPMDAESFRLCADYLLSNLTPLHGRVVALDSVCGEYRVHGANGHVRRVTLDRIRDDIRRTLVTRSLLIEHSRRLGLSGLPDDPASVRSISHTALRAISYHLDRDCHPVPTDDRRRLARLATDSARARHDLPWHRRLIAAVWVISLTLLPRVAVRRLAVPLLGAPLSP